MSPGAGAPGDAVIAEYEALQRAVAAGLERLEGLSTHHGRDEAFALLDAVDGLHRHALQRLLGVLDTVGGAGLIGRVAGDPIVRSLLDLYDLLPADPRAEVDAALREAHPYLESHGGHLEVVGIDDGRVRVHLSGSCETCPGSSVTLRRVVERALQEQVPWFRELLVEDPPPPFTPETPAAEADAAAPGRRPLRRPRWVSVARLGELAPEAVRVVRPEGVALVLVAHGGEILAYADGCPPATPLTLALATLDGSDLVCPWHGCRYDVRTGRRSTGDGRLAVYPVAVRGDDVLIALGTEEVPVG